MDIQAHTACERTHEEQEMSMCSTSDVSLIAFPFWKESVEGEFFCMRELYVSPHYERIVKMLAGQ